MNSPLPEAFVERLKTQFPSQISTSILHSYTLRKKTSIRINTLVSTRDEVTKVLKDVGIKFTDVPWYKDALIVEEKTARDLTELEIYKKGLFYIQSLSSMIPILVLNPQPNETVLDMAAAPGSKTTQLAAAMENTGTIIANDPSSSRTFKLKNNLEMQHVTNTEIISKDGQSLWRDYPEHFDKVLIDVPCSMEGTFSCLEPSSYKYWSPKKVKQLAKMQKWLLRSAVSATKPGGVIVYSTCTLSEDENEKNIEWILEKEKNSLQLENISIPGISSYPTLLGTLRILPSETMEGFFVAKLRKVASNVSIISE
jgi:16S rRNA (cytosine1407-C5)-methyltransferase